MNKVDQDLDLIKRTFSFDYATLPTISEITSVIQEDSWGWSADNKKRRNTYSIRQEYCNYSFSILSHEFMTSLKELVNKYNFKDIHELSCGIGWFTYWSRKYGINTKEAVDDYSWKHCKEFLPLVTKKDSIQHVKDNPQVDLFILSWPYMDAVAERIWTLMKPGQYLLYIGEGEGGCTANDTFFSKVAGQEIEVDSDISKNCISFWGIHDCPYLYRKVRWVYG